MRPAPGSGVLPADTPDASATESRRDERATEPLRSATTQSPPAAEGDDYMIDLIPDELALARTQLASGLAGQAEAVMLRRVARLEAVTGRGTVEELDAARALLAEALWRQGRPLASGEVIDRIRGGSLERRRPLIMLIEAEAHAARGETDRATALMERVVGAVGVDEAWRLRAGLASRLRWPVPPSLRARRGDSGRESPDGSEGGGDVTIAPDPARTAAAHARLEAARLAYGAGDAVRADRELTLALRLDPRIAPEGVALLEPNLNEEPGTERLLLYGDLLRAAGRSAEAAIAFDRAARG